MSRQPPTCKIFLLKHSIKKKVKDVSTNNQLAPLRRWGCHERSTMKNNQPASIRGINPETLKGFKAACIMEEVPYGAKLNDLMREYLEKNYPDLIDRNREGDLTFLLQFQKGRFPYPDIPGMLQPEPPPGRDHAVAAFIGIKPFHDRSFIHGEYPRRLGHGVGALQAVARGMEGSPGGVIVFFFVPHAAP